ncbi:MAG: 2-C-methyl-D-erythritol 4-phosphate cytidylyltransferase [Clostridiales bacterium]|nr:2-C-methyl-D-erythritol 4-phosphate cytidylyltransferase [Clostridiales bacterium]
MPKTEGKVVAIIVAAGRGKRMGMDFNKQFILLNNKPILAYTLEKFEKTESIDEIVLVVGKDEIGFVKENIIDKYSIKKVSKIVAGGKERQDSVYNGLLAVKEHCSIILIHDGARPFIEEELIEKSIDMARKMGAVVVAVPVKDTIKRVDNDMKVIDTLKRDELWSIQTPQTFQYKLLKKAYDLNRENKDIVTDDAMMVERLGGTVNILKGSYKNIKITTPEDLIIAENILKEVW